jgi:effector-binding domain-containing protein
MKIKEVKPINFLFYRTRTTVTSLVDFIPVGQKLYKEAVKNELKITGPVHWHYYNFNGDLSKPFDLEIALPVAQLPREYDGEFHIKRTEPYRCISAHHEGNWFQIPDTYAKIMNFANEKTLAVSSSSREIYINIDENDQSANVTEIQMGIV